MLSILIPTYNRAPFLSRNLQVLIEIIEQGDFINQIDIIVSDNCSTDSTWDDIQKIKRSTNVNIIVYHQDKNIGLQANALFTLSKSESKYVMYLGDDDFISAGFLAECIEIIKTDVNTSTIIPNYIPVSVQGNLVSPSRELIGPTRMFNAGFKSILTNSWKGHQLSGLVFKRENLLEDYLKHKVNNIYLFIFFVANSGLKGNTYLITQNPVLVTQPTEKKDWGYGDDGLINEIFDNYAKLPVTYSQRFQLEFMLLYQQCWRLLMYRQHGLSSFMKAVIKIALAKNATFLFTISFPALLVLIKIKLLLK